RHRLEFRLRPDVHMRHENADPRPRAPPVRMPHGSLPSCVVPLRQRRPDRPPAVRMIDYPAFAITPPSTTCIAPVEKLARSEARNRIALAISVARATRFIGRPCVRMA